MGNGASKGRVAAKIAPFHRAPAAGDHGRQHHAPAVGIIDVPGAQGTSLDIADFVNNEQLMIAGILAGTLAF